ncbi:hypothetical protein Sango_1220600 [Sesamum angolense]|uniref:RNase H type-1 domain-containing protein n=1 Tax=Sesamum angolense TaxID=2727404 RepID=A0AAE1WX72_9LAMI|nr:hypothetical protein Sango_1220600 [Sesamum angolense]
MSFTWKSILDARSVVEKGLRWRIGDGKQVKVWYDPCIPRPHTFLPFTPTNLFLQDLQISDLIDDMMKGWNSDLIEFLFQPEDAKVIRSIPLGYSSLADTQVWHFDRRGVFSIKSAYHVAYKLITDPKHNAAERSYKANVSWSLIWQAKLIGMERGGLGLPCSKEVGTRSIQLVHHDLLESMESEEWQAQLHVTTTADVCPGERLTSTLSLIPEHGEALAARLVVELSLMLGWRSCIIEGDCLQIVQKFQASNKDFSTVGPIIHDIQSLIPSTGILSFNHVRRTANMAAYYLAHLDSSYVQGFKPPSQLLDILRVDARATL